MDPHRPITGKTRLLGVIGWPVEHSCSPMMQAAAIRASGLDLSYVALPVRPESLGDALRGLAALGFVGANVTIPHKEAVARHITDLSPEAKAAGAVNTIIVRSDGSLAGHNTDMEGLVEALHTELDTSLAGARVAIIGCGGAGRGAAFAAARSAAGEIALYNRDQRKADQLASELRRDHPEVTISTMHNLDGEALRRYAVVLQMTSLGMRTGDPLPFNPEQLAKGTIVFDAIVRRGSTDLVLRALELGLPAADGRSMLVAQGALAFKCWTGCTADRAVMRSVLDAFLEIPPTSP